MSAKSRLDFRGVSERATSCVVEDIKIKWCHVFIGEELNEVAEFVLRVKFIAVFNTGVHALTGFFALSALEGVLESANMREKVLFSDVVKGEGEKGVRREGVGVSVENRDVLGKFLFPAKKCPTKVGGVGAWSPCRDG